MKEWWEKVKQSIKESWEHLKIWWEHNWRTILTFGLDKIYEWLRNLINDKKAFKANSAYDIVPWKVFRQRRKVERKLKKRGQK